MDKFDVIFLEQARDFLDGLEEKVRKKVLFNIWKSRAVNDPSLLKKLDRDIWEFRIRFKAKQIRLLAFWDKSDKNSSRIVITHGFVKKKRIIDPREIQKAKQLMNLYFNTGGYEKS
jgi:phage-related protein